MAYTGVPLLSLRTKMLTHSETECVKYGTWEDDLVEFAKDLFKLIQTEIKNGVVQVDDNKLKTEIDTYTEKELLKASSWRNDLSEFTFQMFGKVKAAMVQFIIEQPPLVFESDDEEEDYIDYCTNICEGKRYACFGCEDKLGDFHTAHFEPSTMMRKVGCVVEE